MGMVRIRARAGARVRARVRVMTRVGPDGPIWWHAAGGHAAEVGGRSYKASTCYEQGSAGPGQGMSCGMVMSGECNTGAFQTRVLETACGQNNHLIVLASGAGNS